MDLYAPPGWFPEREFRAGPDDIPFRVMDGFPARASEALFGSRFPTEAADPGPSCAPTAPASAEGKRDLLASVRSGEMSPAARKAVGRVRRRRAPARTSHGPSRWRCKARADLQRLDRRVGGTPALLGTARGIRGGDRKDARAKLSVLQNDAAASDEAIRILKELTDRFPNGTWISSLRIEGRNVEVEGFSPSASELFPALTRDGRFRSVDFGAPIMRQGENMERFKLRGEYVPPQAAPAAAASSGRSGEKEHEPHGRNCFPGFAGCPPGRRG